MRGRIVCYVIAMALSTAAAKESSAVEFSLGLYSLGSGAIGAGQTPPVGFYFTTGLGYSQFSASKPIPFADETVTLKAFSPALVGNILAVLPTDIFGGHLSLSTTSGFGHILLDASSFGGVTAEKSTQGWGALDTNFRASLGWEVSPTFSDKISLTEYLPTGRYGPGFYPVLGLNRLGTDISWGATYIEPTNKIEFSGTVGFTFEGYNDLTLYQSGDTLHFEEGIAKHFDNGFSLGVISYQYTQISDDRGQGAVLGPFRTQAVAVGPTGGYTTIIDGHLVAFSLQATQEVVVKNRLKATIGLFSTTVKF